MTGKPGPDPEVDDKTILQTLLSAYKPALSSTDVAERAGISQQAMSKHLKRLSKDGYVDSDKVGPARIWWVTDEGRRYLNDAEESDQ